MPIKKSFAEDDEILSAFAAKEEFEFEKPIKYFKGLNH